MDTIRTYKECLTLAHPRVALLTFTTSEGTLMSFNSVNQVLHALGRRDRIGHLGLDGNGCAGLTLADGTGVYFEWNEPEQALHLYSPLMEQAAVSRASATPDLYRALLGMNCLANGPVIAMHPEQERVYLQMSFPAEGLNVQTLDQAIDRLTARRNSVRQQLAYQGLAV